MKTTHRAGRFYCGLALSVAPWILGSCAKPGAPQGGPPDTTPPAVELTVPGSAEVFVVLDRGLSLQFSEPIEQSTLEGGLTLSPIRMGPAQLKWSNGSRRVDITWPDSLRDSTTYRVTLSNRVADRRGNKLAEPYTFAFSTGAHVDRGEIRGRVFSKAGKQEAFDAFAYRVETMPDTFWLSPPDYATQTGSDGRFQMPFLRQGLYRLLVLTDANRNQRLDHGEQLAMAARDLIVGDEITADTVMLFPNAFDTVPLTLKSCSPIGPRLITLTFSHPLDLSQASQWRVSAYDSITGAAVDVSRLDPTPRRTGSITLEGNWIEGRGYSFLTENIRDQRGQFLTADSCRCVYANVVDSAGPKIESVYLPSVSVGLTALDSIVWIFSEPIDSTRLGDGLRVRDTAGVPVRGVVMWRDAQTLAFAPAVPWPDTLEIVATIDSALLADRQGNTVVAESYTWRFRPLGEESLGAIEGRIELASSSPTDYWIEANEVGKSRAARIRLTGPGAFTIALPAGRWELGGFVDSNRDGRWSAGTLDPYAAPELRAAPSDTLDVRARFTLEDIMLRF